MIARLYDDGYCVRVDLGDSGQRWPNCDGVHYGFAHLEKYAEGASAWTAATAFAIAQGATDVILSRRDE